MSKMSMTTLIAKLRDLDSGASEGMFSEFSTEDLERAAEWCVHNDPNLEVPIDDELRFRNERDLAVFQFEGEVR